MFDKTASEQGTNRFGGGVAQPYFRGPALSDRAQHGILGGVIGGVAGVVACTVISNLVKDEGTGFSTCTGKGYALFGLSGIGIGALIGSLLN